MYKMIFLTTLSLCISTLVFSHNALRCKSSKCAGAKVCKACRNCKACKHCKTNKGTCGICAKK